MSVQTIEISETIDALVQRAATSLNSQSAEDFEGFERRLSQFGVQIRELQQMMWADEAKTTISNLERNAPLSEADQELIRTFLISDAEHYLEMENNYPDWLEELQRLMDDLSQRAECITRESVGAVRGVVEDAVRLVPQIRNYLDQKRRVQKYHETANMMDGSTRDMLIRILKEQLYSEKR